MDVADFQAIAEKIYTQPSTDPAFNGLSPKEALQQEARGIYPGMTERALEEEAYGFLSKRGANTMHLGYWTGATNRAVLVPKGTSVNGRSESVLSKAQRDAIGFTSVVVYENALKHNCVGVEEAIQRLIEKDGFPLGLRLHRHVAMGNKQDDLDKVLKPDYVCTVFLTSAPYAKILEHCDIQR